LIVRESLIRLAWRIHCAGISVLDWAIATLVALVVAFTARSTFTTIAVTGALFTHFAVVALLGTFSAIS
jgi:hypothetical protein